MSLMAIYNGKAILLKDTTTLETLGCRMRSNIPIVESDDFDANGTIGNIRVDVEYDGYQCNGGTVDNLYIMPIKTLYRDTNGVNQFVTKIANGAFEGGTFSKIIFPQKLTEIGENAFQGCANLQALNFPKTLTTIGNDAFNGCKSLQNFLFPAALTTIGVRAFQNCTSLTSITIPSSVTTIDNWAFSGCRKLATVIYEGTKDSFEKIVGTQNPFANTDVTVIKCLGSNDIIDWQ